MREAFPALTVHHLPTGRAKILLAYLYTLADYIAGLLISMLAVLLLSKTSILMLE